jgi:hypothetical protein
LKKEAFGAATPEVSTEVVSVVLGVVDSLMCRLDHVSHHARKQIYFRYQNKETLGLFLEYAVACRRLLAMN